MKLMLAAMMALCVLVNITSAQTPGKVLTNSCIVKDKNAINYILIIVNALTLFGSHSISEFTQQPVSMNYNKGEEFIFTCSATNVDLLNFLVNGVQNNDEGFTETSTNTDDLSTRDLTGTAQIQQNNTNISCVGSVIGGASVISDIAVLLIQGNDNRHS